MSEGDKRMNSQHFESEAPDVRIRINPEIRIWNRNHFCNFWRRRRLRRFAAFALSGCSCLNTVFVLYDVGQFVKNGGRDMLLVVQPLKLTHHFPQSSNTWSLTDSKWCRQACKKFISRWDGWMLREISITAWCTPWHGILKICQHLPTLIRKTRITCFWSASLYFSERGAYWDRLCRDVVGRWLVVTRVHCGQTVHPRPIVTMEH